MKKVTKKLFCFFNGFRRAVCFRDWRSRGASVENGLNSEHTLTGVNATVRSTRWRRNSMPRSEREQGIAVKSIFQGNDNSEKLKTLAQAGDTKNFPDVAMIVGAGNSLGFDL